MQDAVEWNVGSSSATKKPTIIIRDETKRQFEKGILEKVCATNDDGQISKTATNAEKSRVPDTQSATICQVMPYSK